MKQKQINCHLSHELFIAGTWITFFLFQINSIDEFAIVVDTGDEWE